MAALSHNFRPREGRRAVLVELSTQVSFGAISEA